MSKRTKDRHVSGTGRTDSDKRSGGEQLRLGEAGDETVEKASGATRTTPAGRSRPGSRRVPATTFLPPTRAARCSSQKRDGGSACQRAGARHRRVRRQRGWGRPSMLEWETRERAISPRSVPGAERQQFSELESFLSCEHRPHGPSCVILARARTCRPLFSARVSSRRTRPSLMLASSRARSSSTL